MSEWKAKRFWKAAAVTEAGGGFTVELDGRPVKTPAKAALIVPSRALAQEIAQEWDAQEGEIRPAGMPATRFANAAIDKVAHQHGEVAQMLAGYGDADLLCYRAAGPVELVQRQVAAWDPLLDWAESVLGARLVPVQGVMHVAQARCALEHLAGQVRQMDHFSLTAFHDLVSLSGSLIIGFAALHDVHPPETLWRLSRIDEAWQAELWGRDEEAHAAAQRKQADFFNAKRFYDHLRNQS